MIDSALSGYTTSAQLHTGFYSKVERNLIFDTYTTTIQLYNEIYSKGCVNQMLVQSTTLFEFDYTKGDIHTILTDKVSNTGTRSLGHWYYIRGSRIRCNAELGGYTGYAELKAGGGDDMCLNLSATRTDGGWMYFKINNDDYIQLSGSDNKVDIYKDTTISGNSGAQRLALNKPSNDSETPLKITNNSQNWGVMALGGTIAGDGCLQNFKTAQSPTLWDTGVWNQNQYGIRHGVHGLWFCDNGNTSISGNLDVGPFQANTSIKTYVHYGACR